MMETYSLFTNHWLQCIWSIRQCHQFIFLHINCFSLFILLPSSFIHQTSVFSVAKTHMSRTAKGPSAPLSNYRLLDTLHDIPNILIRHIRPRRQAEPNLKQFLLDAIGIYRSTGIHRLLVHGFPRGARLNLLE